MVWPHACVRRLTPLQAVDLPELPANAKYMHHPNQCYDWGTFGWVFMTEGIAPSSYKYFIFLNSSVRGPFLPTYLKALHTPFPADLAAYDCPSLPCPTFHHMKPSHTDESLPSSWNHVNLKFPVANQNIDGD